MRAAICLVAFANLALLFLITRHFLSRSESLGVLSLATGLLLIFPEHLLGIRADPWLLLCFCIGLLATLGNSRSAAMLLSGICGGFALDFKLSVAPIVWLLLFVLYRRHGRRAMLVSIGAIFVTSFSPFLLPGISMTNYLGWLLLSAHQGLLRSLFLEDLGITVLLVLPGIVFYLLGARMKGVRLIYPDLAALALLALCSTILTGSKDGAGPWHLLPMLPFALLWTAYEAKPRGSDAAQKSGGRSGVASLMGGLMHTRRLRVLAAITISATALSLRYGYRDFFVVRPHDYALRWQNEHAAEFELESLVHRYANRNLAMGYGKRADNDYRANLRFVLPMYGQEYFLDDNALVEALKAGSPPPSSLVQRIVGCQDLWLIPHSEPPFGTLRKGVISTTVSPFLFPDSVRLHFTDMHKLLLPGVEYDVWGCPASS